MFLVQSSLDFFCQKRVVYNTSGVKTVWREMPGCKTVSCKMLVVCNGFWCQRFVDVLLMLGLLRCVLCHGQQQHDNGQLLRILAANFADIFILKLLVSVLPCTTGT